MKERNYDRLRRALDRLPAYDAPGQAWENLRPDLDRQQLRHRLPSYAPPPGVWNEVSQQLDRVPSDTAAVRRLPKLALATAAAAVLVLIAATTFFSTGAGEGTPTVSYAYSQEATPAPVIEDWDDDEPSFSQVRQKVTDRNEPVLNSLGHELDELTSAREEVKAMLVAYGNDPSVVQQLAEIERERDDVYRRIIVEL